jgi:hypothetical protein
MADALKEVTWVANAKHEARVANAAAKEMARHCDKRIAKYERLCSLLIEALTIYADPSFYHAITIIGDRPTGGFDEDVSRVHGSIYNRPMPGKLARKALRDAERLVGSAPEVFGRASTAMGITEETGGVT